MIEMKKSLTTLSDADINFYDTGSILQMLNIMGFVPLNIKTDKIPLPFLGKIVRRLKVVSLTKFMEKRFVFFGEKTIVKAKKKKIDYWNKLDKKVREKQS